MKPVHGFAAVLLFSAHLLVPAPACARQVDDLPAGSAFDSPFQSAVSATQHGPSLQQQSSQGGKLLRNALIGAAVGATTFGILARGFGDCGDCSGDQAKAVLSGAMYGALIGAAIRLGPALRPSPTQSPRKATLSPHVSKRVKAVNLVLQF